jgi:hypothetical protein
LTFLKNNKNEVRQKFKVEGIPRLVLLDADSGNVVCQDARMGVYNDSEGKNFPWSQRK